jgi:hypothetical protein
MKRSQIGFAPLLAVLALTIIAGTGCITISEPASASFASVIIPGKSVAEIQQAAEAVFQADGYLALRKPGGGMNFQKDASRSKQLAYSSIGGGVTGESVKLRVRAEIVDLNAGSHRLQCQAYVVRHAGDSFFEEELALTGMQRGPYQKLLDEVARRLK